MTMDMFLSIKMLAKLGKIITDQLMNEASSN